MNQQKQLLLFLVVIILIIAVWALFFREPKTSLPTAPVAQPTVVTPKDDGKFTPELNNTLETTVTVIEPSDVIE